MMKKWTQFIVGTIAAVLIFALPVQANAFQVVNKDLPLSSGVQYKNYTYKNTYTNSINHLAINLQDPYTALKIGVPSPINSVATTTKLANSHSFEGNRVVGAVNAGFYNMSTGFPMYLISQNNEIVNGGVLSDSYSAYVSSPIAFGIREDGTADIESFDFDINLKYNNQDYEITGLNRERQDNEAIIFTPLKVGTTTGSNKYGLEFVIETEEPVTSNYFGQTLTGKITQIRDYGSEEVIRVPKNGFVLSVNGKKWIDSFKNMKIGEQVSVGFDINKNWKNSQFMLGSGPMLVKDGQRYITMNTSSSRATEIAPRSAIAISADKKQVHLVTVDGRLGSFSKGMSLTQFADYLVKLGFDRAINLDGGGSTTMGIRNYGSNNVVLANRPSDGYERRVSTILEAISTAPTSSPAHINASRDKTGTMLLGSSITLKLNYVMDAYYNNITIDPSKVIISSENNLVNINGYTYTASKVGQDRVLVNYESAVQSFPVTIVSEPATLSIASSAKTINTGGTINFSATAKDAAGNGLLYNPSQLSWTVEGNIGTIASNGKFTASNTAGKGKIIAQLGTKKVSVDVEVTEPASSLQSPFSDVSNKNVYLKEIVYLTNNGYIHGYEDSTFKPEQNLSRAHAAVLISRALKLDLTSVTDPGFKDVPTTHPYYREIAAVANARIVGGKENNLYDPQGTLTRAQMAAILTNAYKLTGTSTTKFSDVKSGYWAEKSISALAFNDITTGYADGTFKPSVPVTRMHFSVFLYRSIHR
ncbi:S-layer homology domain-containing protein [Psychrobacillus sp. FSL H8-0484]|uniref:S-layer homology domain-containing protein n=1 Tax=Psychrobacillus sp. FSL H8-0484 TaxID=2921390 RepID=UPI0030F7F475